VQTFSHVGKWILGLRWIKIKNLPFRRINVTVPDAKTRRTFQQNTNTQKDSGFKYNFVG